jgi:hypothetical protein
LFALTGSRHELYDPTQIVEGGIAMNDETTVEGGAPRLHVARAKYLTAYMLLSCATKQLERLAVTRGAYKRTRRSIVRAAAVLMLATGLLGLGTPRTSHATPVFAAPVANPFGSGPVFLAGVLSSPALADIDGDGDLDLFQSGFLNLPAYKYVGTFFHENTGTASAAAFTYGGLNPFGLVPSYLGGNLSGSYFHGGAELVDIDGDTDLDLFIQNAGYGVDFFQNGGTPVAPSFAAAGLPAGMIASGFGDAQSFVDIDGDLDLDLFAGVSGGSPYIGFQLNSGTPVAATFDPAVADPFGLSAPDFHPTPEFADIDGDGDLDVFIGKYSGGIVVHINTGTPIAPAFAPGTYNPFGLVTIPGTYSASPELADIDDDGDLDLFVGTRSNGAYSAYSDLYFYENLEIDCGDGVIAPSSEVCDGAALGGETCENQGYDSGALACASDCLSLDASACVGVPCPPTPSGGCLAPGKAQFQLKSNADPTKQQLKFKWQKGAMFDHLMLGDPVTTTDVALCIYDETATVPSLVGRVSVPANALWVNKDPKGFQFKDKTGVYDSVTKAQLKPNAAGKSSVALQAKGANLTLPTPISVTEYFDQDTNVTVQLVSESGICWSASFAAGTTKKNDGVQFKAK